MAEADWQKTRRLLLAANSIQPVRRIEDATRSISRPLYAILHSPICDVMGEMGTSGSSKRAVSRIPRWLSWKNIAAAIGGLTLVVIALQKFMNEIPDTVTAFHKAQVAIGMPPPSESRSVPTPTATAPHLSSQPDKAEASAKELVKNFGDQNYQTIWDSETSAWFKQRVTRDAFLANMTMGRQSLGKLSKSVMISSDHSNQDPQSGYQGDIYAFTFRNSYPVGDFFERVVVIKENDGVYRLAGIFGSPAPKPTGQ